VLEKSAVNRARGKKVDLTRKLGSSLGPGSQCVEDLDGTDVHVANVEGERQTAGAEV